MFGVGNDRPGMGKPQPEASSEELPVRGARTRRVVSLDTPSSRLGPFSESPPAENRSDGGRGGSVHAQHPKFVEFKVTTLVMLSASFVLLVLLAFIAGRNSAPDAPPAGMVAMSESEDWLPTLDPVPVVPESIRNVLDENGQPIVDQISSDPSLNVPDESSLAAAAAPVESPKWGVMIGQKLTVDLKIIDQLLTYVDSGLSPGETKIRVRDKGGKKRYDVIAGPYDTQAEAKNAYTKIMQLRNTQGVRFSDCYIARLKYLPDESSKGP